MLHGPKNLEKDEHTPETEEYGISSFVYRSKKPFDPVRFFEYVQQKFPTTIIRSKGLFWLASRPEQAISWSQAGGSLSADSAGVWWSSMPFEQRTRYAVFVENQKLIEKDWHKEFGDRKNEIVLIGQEMDKELIIQQLDACLSTDEELLEGKWKNGYKDEWPVQRMSSLN